MSGNSLLLDTNIILYFLTGDETLLPLFEEKDLLVSVITELELLGYKELSDDDRDAITQFLRHCTVINLTTEIKEETITLRKQYNLKLPDAIIMATAINLDIPLITADEEFEKVETGKVILYEN